MRAAKVQASLRIRAVSPEPSLLAHISSESRGTFRQKARSLAPLNGWACAVKICHDRMLEDTNSLDGAYIIKTNKSLNGFKAWTALTLSLVGVVYVSAGCYRYHLVPSAAPDVGGAPSQDHDALLLVLAGLHPWLLNFSLCSSWEHLSYHLYLKWENTA